MINVYSPPSAVKEKGHNVEDRSFWYETGAEGEIFFVEKIAPRIGLQANINPAKDVTPWAHDLFIGDRPADLKRQTTPFYTASQFGLDPRFAISLNIKDQKHYLLEYGEDFLLVFWLMWPQDTEPRFGISVPPMHGVWITSMGHIMELDANDPIARHSYKRRGGAGNATESLVLNVREFDLLYFNGYGVHLN